MALSLSSRGQLQTRALGAPAARPGVRRIVTPPRAFLGLDKVAEGFMKIFSKPTSTMNDDDWQSAGSTGFQGKISHHGAGRPFKDQWVGQKLPAGAKAEGDAAAGNKSYLGEAVERVVGHNFTGDENEPPAGAGSAGWKGQIHDRKTGDGFHSRSL